MTCPKNNNKHPLNTCQPEVKTVLPEDLSSDDRHNLLEAINGAWLHSWGWHRYDSYQAFEQEITQADSKLLLIQEHANYTGGVFYLEDAPEAPDMLYFGTLWTAPHKLKNGQGSRLVTLLEKKSKALKKKGVHIVVNLKLPEMIVFYEKRGYVKTGDSKQHIGFICMEKIVR